jgi:hypothetical protein
MRNEVSLHEKLLILQAKFAERAENQFPLAAAQAAVEE